MRRRALALVGLLTTPHAGSRAALGAGAHAAAPRTQGHEGRAQRVIAVKLFLGLVFLEQALISGKFVGTAMFSDQIEAERPGAAAPDGEEGRRLETELDVA